MAEPMQPPAPVNIEFGPVPVRTEAATVAGPDGKHLIMLQVFTPQGVQAFFLSDDHAKALASQLQALASAAASGLFLPGSPNGHG